MSQCWPSGIEVHAGQVANRSFGGFVTDEDPHDLPPGTAIQPVNVGASGRWVAD
jgi:hypothetical protein